MHLLNCIVTSRDRINCLSILSEVSSAAGEVKIDFVISLATFISGYLHFIANKLEEGELILRGSTKMLYVINVLNYTLIQCN